MLLAQGGLGKGSCEGIGKRVIPNETIHANSSTCAVAWLLSSPARGERWTKTAIAAMPRRSVLAAKGHAWNMLPLECVAVGLREELQSSKARRICVNCSIRPVACSNCVMKVEIWCF